MFAFYLRRPREIQLIGKVAAGMGATPAQIALARQLSQNQWIVPIPGSGKLARLEESLSAAAVVPAAEDIRRIDSAPAKIPMVGRRGTGQGRYGQETP